MNLRRFALWCAVVFALPEVCVAEDAATAFQSRVLPILKTHCARCHGTEKPKAKITLVSVRSQEQLAVDRELWFRVLDQIEAGAMPPEGEKTLSKPDRQAIIAWIRGEFTELL